LKQLLLICGEKINNKKSKERNRLLSEALSHFYIFIFFEGGTDIFLKNDRRNRKNILVKEITNNSCLKES